MFKNIRSHLHWYLLGAILLFLLYLVFGSDGYFGGADNITHYMIARYAFRHPELFLNAWGRPLFTIPAAPFAQFGLEGVKIFNCLAGLATAWLVYRIACRARLRNPDMAIILVIFTPLYLMMLPTAMTEVVFGLVVTLALFLFMRKSYIASAIVISFVPFARTEGFLFLPLYLTALAATGWYRYRAGQRIRSFHQSVKADRPVDMLMSETPGGKPQLRQNQGSRDSSMDSPRDRNAARSTGKPSSIPPGNEHGSGYNQCAGDHSGQRSADGTRKKRITLHYLLAENLPLRAIPFLATGVVVFSLAGWSHFGDPFWVFTQFPYPVTYTHPIYNQSGSLWHFLGERQYILGLPVEALFIAGSLALFTRLYRQLRGAGGGKRVNGLTGEQVSGETGERVSGETGERVSVELEVPGPECNQSFLILVWLALLPFVLYLAFHSVLYWKAMGGSMGLTRVMAAVSPLASLVAMVGYDALVRVFGKPRQDRETGSIEDQQTRPGIGSFEVHQTVPETSHDTTLGLSPETGNVSQNQGAYHENKIRLFTTGSIQDVSVSGSSFAGHSKREKSISGKDNEGKYKTFLSRLHDVSGFNFNETSSILTTIATVILAGWIIATPFVTYTIPHPPFIEEEMVKETVAWVRSSPYKDRFFFYTDYNVPFYIDTDPFEKPPARCALIADPKYLDTIPQGSIIIWDAHFGSNESKIPIDSLLLDPRQKLVQWIQPEKPWITFNGFGYYCCVTETIFPPAGRKGKGQNAKDKVKEQNEKSINQSFSQSVNNTFTHSLNHSITHSIAPRATDNYAIRDSILDLLDAETSIDTLYLNRFEDRWDAPDSTYLIPSARFGGRYAFVMDQRTEFSPGICCQKVSDLPMPGEPFAIRFSGRVRLPDAAVRAKIMLVVSFEKDFKSYSYTGLNLAERRLPPDRWVRVSITAPLPNYFTPNDVMKVYLWNPEKACFLVDEMKVEVVRF